MITGQIYYTSWASSAYWLLDGDYYAQNYPFDGFSTNTSSQISAEVNTTGTVSLI